MRLSTHSAMRVVLLLILTAAVRFPSAAATAPPPPPKPIDLMKAALDQIYDSGLLPSSTWNGWEPSDGLTEGTYAGGPFIKFDDTTIMSVPFVSVNGNQYGALADPLPPYSPTGQMGIWMSRAALDSNLLWIKTALFHELVHISELRDVDGIWTTLANGTVVYNETRKGDLAPIREVSASIRTIQFLQMLLKKVPPEFPKADIIEQIKSQMNYLQAKIAEAAKNAGKFKTDKDKEMLKRWMPNWAIALILMKKFAFYSWVDDGIITNENLSHIRYICNLLDELEGSVRDGKVAGNNQSDSFSIAIHEAVEEAELNDTSMSLVRSVLSWYNETAPLQEAIDLLDMARTEIRGAVTGNDTDSQEDLRGALLMVDAVEAGMTDTLLPATEARLILPPFGMTAIIPVAVEDSGIDSNASDAFFSIRRSVGGKDHVEIGQDLIAHDGWTYDWNSMAYPFCSSTEPVEVEITAGLWSADGQYSEATAVYTVDINQPCDPPPVEVKVETPTPGSEVKGIVSIEASAHLPEETSSPSDRRLAELTVNFYACEEHAVDDDCEEIGETTVNDIATGGNVWKATHLWDSKTRPDGPVILRVITTDPAGVESSPADSTVHVNNIGMKPLCAELGDPCSNYLGCCPDNVCIDGTCEKNCIESGNSCKTGQNARPCCDLGDVCQKKGKRNGKVIRKCDKLCVKRGNTCKKGKSSAPCCRSSDVCKKKGKRRGRVIRKCAKKQPRRRKKRCIERGFPCKTPKFSKQCCRRLKCLSKGNRKGKNRGGTINKVCCLKRGGNKDCSKEPKKGGK